MNEIKNIIPLKYEIYRGDSIQAVIDNPADSLLAAILLRAGVRSKTPKDTNEIWDMRVSVGIGEIEFWSDNIPTSDGEAFRLSGRGLDSIGKSSLCINTPWKNINGEFYVNSQFIDDVICNWSSTQARVMFLALQKHRTKKEIGAELGQTHQNVSKLLIAAKEKLIRISIDRFTIVINSKEL
ncbi:MAG: helix-turn-helix domain-containing protein [Prevotellaceae bacterium]|nr:helix-turn-helix domain-containing protein [Prevotellaceae bacterium]